MKRAIHWFRRDLRVTDNLPLSAAAAAAREVIPVYIVSSWSGEHGWTGSNRQSFLCGCLKSLAGNLESIGGRLIVRRGDAVDILSQLVAETGAEAVFFARDPDPFGRRTEERLRARAAAEGFAVHESTDVTIHERREVLTATGDPFRVFTPYSKAWMKLDKPASAGRLKSLLTPDEIPSDPLPDLGTWNLPPAAAGIIEAGEKAARSRLSAFLGEGIRHYGERRNFPGGAHTSRLSQDLRFGLLSIREVYQRSVEAAEAIGGSSNGAQKFISELIWREFYIQLLWNFPDVLENEFNPKFRGMRWPGSKEGFERWCAGETGFPIVDAAMRELRETGFMHNRTRMITAMFLTKDLHLDWRDGERFFMQQLTDGEIASNNGGWQWSAGTGADAAPYFRIQNPWTQTLRYDPDGDYIKRWIPELRDIAPARLMAPPPEGEKLARGYPTPIVDHAWAREKTLALYAAATA